MGERRSHSASLSNGGNHFVSGLWSPAEIKTGASEELRAHLEAVLAPDIVRALESLVVETVRVQIAEHAVATNPVRKWLTLAEAGDRLGVSADAVRMRVKRGRLAAERQGSRLYVSAASVESLR